jgi:hypothetical protein
VSATAVVSITAEFESTITFAESTEFVVVVSVLFAQELNKVAATKIAKICFIFFVLLLLLKVYFRAKISKKTSKKHT